MDKDAYIKQLEDEIVELKKRIEELERLLGMNSQNSSKPPSTNPPGVSAVLPRRRRRKRGAKNGHQPHGGFDYSGPMTEVILLGNVALRTGEKLAWSGEKMKATNCPNAEDALA